MTIKPPPSAKEILYIEASDLILGWVVPLLEKLGCHVTQANDQKTATRIIRQQNKLDLIILGDLTRHIRTPSATKIPIELSLLIQLRNNTQYLKTPVVVFTSTKWLPEDQKQHVTASLFKPAGAIELETLLLPYLQNK